MRAAVAVVLVFALSACVCVTHESRSTGATAAGRTPRAICVAHANDAEADCRADCADGPAGALAACRSECTATADRQSARCGN